MEPLSFKHPEVPGLVTIVTPMRNGRRFLEETFGGVAGQTYTNWELVVVEDGSRDGSEDLVRNLAARFPENRVVYLYNDQSCGAAYSRNRAFLEARGEYIAFLDCDDRWLPTHLDACVDALRTTGDDLAYSTVVMFADSDGGLVGLWGPTPGEINSFPHSLFYRSFVTPSATVVRRSVIGEIGAWDSQYHCCEDADFMLRAAMTGKRFRYVGGAHCLYRKEHAEATTQKLAETIEEYATICTKYVGGPDENLKRRQRGVATSFEIAAKLHSQKRLSSDPSANPARAATLYYKAWQTRPRRVKNLLKSLICRLRYGAAPGIQPIDRPSLPASSPHVETAAA